MEEHRDGHTRTSQAIVGPNWGLYLDRVPLEIPVHGLADGYNFRIKNSALTNLNLGWELFSLGSWLPLNGPVALIDNFFPRDLDEQLIFGTPSDIYLYHTGNPDSVTFLTPRYQVGTASVAGTAVTGIGTDWSPIVDAGDEIAFGATDINGVDPHGNDAFTKVLLHMEGADASTTFTDHNAGGAAHTWTAAGNAQIDTADKQFGAASGLFDGTGDFITTPDHANYVLGTSDFAIDFWFKVNGGDGALLYLAGQNDSPATAAGSSFIVYRFTDNTIRVSLSDGTVFVALLTAATYTTASNPGWHHLAVVRNGNNIFLYIDGVQADTAAFSGTVPNSASVLGVGCAGAITTNPWNGWIDEFRLSVGAARFTAAFTVEATAYSTPWLEITNVGSDTALTLGASAGTIVAGPYTIRLKFEGSIGSVGWDFDTFVNDGDTGDDLWFVTNGVDPVLTWNGVDTQLTPHPELLFTCKTLATFSNMMLYANVTQAGSTLPTDMINSDPGLPLHAGALATGLSEQFRIHSGTDEVNQMVPLGDTLVLYSPRHIVTAQFVGDPLVFIFRDALAGIGPTSPDAVADFGDFHEFIGPDSGYSFDGVALRETNAHVLRDVLRQQDPVRKERAFAHFDEENGDLIWSMSSNLDAGVGNVDGQSETAWVEHYLEEVPAEVDTPFSKRAFPFTTSGFYERKVGSLWSVVGGTWDESNFAWDDQALQLGFPLNLTGDNDGFIYKINTVQLGNGELLPSFVRFGLTTTGTGRERNIIRRIYPHASYFPGNTLTVTLWMTDHADGALVNKGDFSFVTDHAEGNFFVNPFGAGRYMSIQYSTSGTQWRLTGYDYDVVPGGER